MWVTVLITMLIYLVLAGIIGIWAGRGRVLDVVDYVAGSRTLGLVVMYFIMGATIFSAFAFLGGPGWAYSRGAAAFYILAYCGFGLAPWYVFGPRAARLGRKYGYVTQAELFSDRYESKTLSGIMAWVSLAAFVPYLTLQMKGAGYIFDSLTQGHVPFWAGALIAYGVVVFYVFMSGLMGVGWTNVFQGLLMLILAWIFGIMLPFKLYGGLVPMFEKILAASPGHLTIPGPAKGAMPWGAYSTAVLISVLGFAMWPHLYMKAYTARDEATLKLTIAIYPTFAIFMVPVLLIGFSGVVYAPNLARADSVLPHMIMALKFAPIVVGLFGAGALAAGMSSGDAITHAAASVMVQDFVKLFIPKATDKTLTTIMRILVIVVAAVSYYFAVVAKVSLVMLLLGAYGAVVQFFPLALGMHFWPRANKKAALAGLIVGGLVTLFGTMGKVPFLGIPFGKVWNMHPGITGLICNFIVFIVISLLTKPQSPDHLRRFIEE